MKLYLQLFASTVLSLLTITILLIFLLDDGAHNLVYALGTIIIAGKIVFLFYGALLSILWYLFYRFVFSAHASQIKAHKSAVFISAILTPALAALIALLPQASSLADFIDIIKHIVKDLLITAIISMPIAFLSLFFFWLLFLRKQLVTKYNPTNPNP